MLPLGITVGVKFPGWKDDCREMMEDIADGVNWKFKFTVEGACPLENGDGSRGLSLQMNPRGYHRTSNYHFQLTNYF